MDKYTECLEKLIPAANKKRVWLFFLAFSRFEYALKKSGFAARSAERIDRAWDRFASKYCDSFQSDLNPRLKTACDYFESHPPKKQIVDGSSLAWEESHPRGRHPLLCWLVTMIRRVRNNLFHGGKEILDPARDLPLINHSLVILEALLDLDTSVRQHFMEPTP